MERYHDTSRDPLPLVSPQHEIERQRLADATAAFLASGGQVQQVGFQMKDAPETFVINAKKTPVYAHLFVPPEPELLSAKAQPAPTVAQVELVQQLQDEQPAQHQVVTKSRKPGMTTAALASRLMVQAALGATPAQAARAVSIPEKQVRQVARDHNIKFKRQR